MAHIQTKNAKLWIPQSTHENVDSQKMFIENINRTEELFTDLLERVSSEVDSISGLKHLDVSSDDTIIVTGTLVLVVGKGIYYYNADSTEDDDDDEIVKPAIGEGRWILAGGGGNLIVDKEIDYGEDTDDDQDGILIKIKKLFDKKSKSHFFPVTTTKAVRDTKTKKSLFEILNITPNFTEDPEQVNPVANRDADTLGGRVTAETIGEIERNIDSFGESISDIKYDITDLKSRDTGSTIYRKELSYAVDSISSNGGLTYTINVDADKTLLSITPMIETGNNDIRIRDLTITMSTPYTDQTGMHIKAGITNNGSAVSSLSIKFIIAYLL